MYQMEQSHAGERSLVVFVHGTFAADEENEGERWWQANSPVWNDFRERLPEEGFELAQGGDVFHWSGENTERDRIQGAKALLERLIEFEREGRRYHLVGHSHGGSIIWTALKESVLCRWNSARNEEELKLQGLQSWTTVGSPFLHFRSSAIGRWWGKALTFLTFWLTIVAIAFLAVQINAQFDVAESVSRKFGGESSPVAAAEPETPQPLGSEVEDEKPGRLPSESEVRKAVKRVGGQVTQIHEQQKLDSVFDWVAFVFFCVVLPPLLFAIYAWLFAVRTEARAVRRERRIENQAILEFGSCWLGLWSKQDEAINGLKSTLRLGGNIFPRIEIPEERVFVSDRIIQFYRFFLRRVLAPVVNRTLVPFGDRVLWSKMSKSAQGDNRRGCWLANVSEAPVLLGERRFPSLPESVEEEVITAANQRIETHSGTILPKAREALGQFAWGSATVTSLIEDNAETFSEAQDMLIHTSYFENAGIREMICDHLDPTSPSPPGSDPESRLHPWRARFLEAKSELLLNNEAIKSRALPMLGNKNRGQLIGAIVSLILTPLLIFLGPLGLLLILGSVITFSAIGLSRARLGARKGTSFRVFAELIIYLGVAFFAFFAYMFHYLTSSYSQPDPDLVKWVPQRGLSVSAGGRHLFSGSEDGFLTKWSIDDGSGTPLLETSGPIVSFAISPDESLLAVSGEDHTVAIHDAATGDRQFSFVGHTDSVEAMAFSPNGGILATSSHDRTASIWLLDGRRHLRTLKGHSGKIRCLAFSPNGNLLATGSEDRTVRIWIPALSKAILTLKGHGGTVLDVSFNPTANLLASCDEVGNLIIWDFSSGRAKHRFQGDDEGISAVAFAQQEPLMALGSKSGKVSTWDYTTGTKLNESQLHSAAVRSVRFASDGTSILSSSEDHLIRKSELGERPAWSALDLRGMPVDKIAFSQDGKYMATGAKGHHAAKVWDLPTRKVTQLLTGESVIDRLMALHYSGNSKRFLRRGFMAVDTWEAGDFVPRSRVTYNRISGDSGDYIVHGDGPAIASDSLRFAASTWLTPEGKPGYWDLVSGEFVSFDAESGSSFLSSMTFNNGGSLLATYGFSELMVWDCAEGKALFEMTVNHLATEVSISSLGGALAVQMDEDIVLMNATTGSEIRRLRPPTEITQDSDSRTLAWSHDDSLLALAESGNIFVWELETGDDPVRLETHDVPRYVPVEVQFAPTRRHLISTAKSDEPTVRAVYLWNLETGSDRAELVHKAPVHSAVFTPDGKNVACGLGDGTIHFWDVETLERIGIIKDFE